MLCLKITRLPLARAVLNYFPYETIIFLYIPQLVSLNSTLKTMKSKSSFVEAVKGL